MFSETTVNGHSNKVKLQAPKCRVTNPTYIAVVNNNLESWDSCDTLRRLSWQAHPWKSLAACCCTSDVGCETSRHSLSHYRLYGAIAGADFTPWLDACGRLNDVYDNDKCYIWERQIKRPVL